MMEFLWSPLPIIFIFLALMTLGTPSIAARKWAKVGRVITKGLLAVYVLFVVHGMNEKGCYGLRKSDASSVAEFTKEVSKLIVEGKNQKAKELLDKFSEKYPKLAGHDEMMKDFLDKLGEDARKK